MKNMFKKADFVLLAILILIGIALSAVSVLSASRGAKAVVTVDGEIYGTYSLSRNLRHILSFGRSGDHRRERRPHK